MRLVLIAASPSGRETIRITRFVQNVENSSVSKNKTPMKKVIILRNALVTGMGRQAGRQDCDMIAVKGTVKYHVNNKNRIIVKDDENGKHFIFENGSGQILEG